MNFRYLYFIHFSNSCIPQNFLIQKQEIIYICNSILKIVITKNLAFSVKRQMKNCSTLIKRSFCQRLMKNHCPENKFSTKKMAHYASIIRHEQTTHHWNKGQGKISQKELTFILWNVNGFRSVKEKGHLSRLFSQYKHKADFICLNQTKIDFEKYKEETLKEKLFIKQAQMFNQYWNFCKVSSGYSGVMNFSKHLPVKVIEDMPDFKEHNKEGRLITLEFDSFYLLNLYKPNAGEQLDRLDYRLEYEDCLRQLIKKLQQKKPVILVGDMNVANEQIDLKNPRANQGKACYTQLQRQKFKQLLSQCSLIDSYRHMNPQTVKYSCWTYQQNARARNVGWRLDYILVDKRLKIQEAEILNDIYGSDHCPVLARISLV